MIGIGIGVIFDALFPGLVGLLYQIPLAALIAWLAIRGEVARQSRREMLLPLIAAIGVGGPVAVFVIARIPIPLSWVLALVAHWVGVSMLLDYYLDVRLEESYRLTGSMLVPTWLAWLIMGAARILIAGVT
ncbi:MAG: hypothetical protein U9R79_17860 [Armatimonadota bacterium]|nr:hypothetical protein [Armatimonadota bacterium]